MSQENQEAGGDQKWHVIRCVELGAPAAEVWELIGGFFTIHEWHPDITHTEIPAQQTSTRQLRRILTFPGQPTTTEELVFMNNADFHYGYRWYEGPWGEAVKNYRASLRVFAGDQDKSCTVQWASTFDHPTDAISVFYLNGFRELQKRFPLGEKE